MEKRIKRLTRLKILILRVIKEIDSASLEVIDKGFLNPAYSFTHPTRVLFGLPLPSDKILHNKKFIPNKKQIAKQRSFIAINLRRLEKEGLVKNSGTPRNFSWQLTSDGLRILQQSIEENKDMQIPDKDNILRVVTFDIPERERWKRTLIRQWLRVCDYRNIQQSVWIGKRPLPKIFIKELEKYRLQSCVHIFEISKKGTIGGF